MKPIKVPTDLLSEPFNNKALCMNGLSVVDSCYYDRTTTGSMYLEEHVIFSWHWDVRRARISQMCSKIIS